MDGVVEQIEGFGVQGSGFSTVKGVVLQRAGCATRWFWSKARRVEQVSHALTPFHARKKM